MPLIKCPEPQIENKIFLIRGKKIMLDRDLAELYGVPTKRLNEQVRRNIKRFPEDFMFQLTKIEKAEVVANCDHLKVLKFSPQLPYAFTENGIAMLSSVLNSERSIQVNIKIMRAFTMFREYLSTHKELAIKFKELETRIDTRLNKQDKKIQSILEAINCLLSIPEKHKKIVGFTKQ